LKPPFEILEHPSDLGIEANGSTIQEMFRNAAQGLMAVITDETKIEVLQERKVEISSIDRENLLVRWLTEILYLYDAKKFLTGNVKFDILCNTSLKATLFGEFCDPAKHELKLDVKAITYHQLKIEERNGFWTARVFVDI
jgi:SHS2 domain-containing protein